MSNHLILTAQICLKLKHLWFVLFYRPSGYINPRGQKQTYMYNLFTALLSTGSLYSLSVDILYNIVKWASYIMWHCLWVNVELAIRSLTGVLVMHVELKSLLLSLFFPQAWLLWWLVQTCYCGWCTVDAFLLPANVICSPLISLTAL